MQVCADAALLTPDQRLRELARIFGVGVLRLRRRIPMTRRHEITGNSFAERLEVSPDTVLIVSVPVNAPESPTLGEPA